MDANDNFIRSNRPAHPLCECVFTGKMTKDENPTPKQNHPIVDPPEFSGKTREFTGGFGNSTIITITGISPKFREIRQNFENPPSYSQIQKPPSSGYPLFYPIQSIRDPESVSLLSPPSRHSHSFRLFGIDLMDFVLGFCCGRLLPQPVLAVWCG